MASGRSWLAVGTLVATLLVALTLLVGCSDGSKSTSGPTTIADIAHSVSATPSVSAKMICETEAKDDIYKSATGVKTIAAFKPTWVDNVYSCNYDYPGGAVMTLSVKELSSAAKTTAYFNSLATKLGKTKDQPALAKSAVAQGAVSTAQGAFSTKDGSVVVRKDYRVLLVDVSKLPESFGVPADSRSDVAINVANTIMLCWTGL